MKTCVSIVFFIIVSVCGAQINVVSENMRVCTDSLTSEGRNFEALFVFSSAVNSLSQEQQDSIVRFVRDGGNLYCGFENDPLQAECAALIRQMFGLETYPAPLYCCEEIRAESNTAGKLGIPVLRAECTPVYFPIDYRFTVEVWQEDQPMVVSARFGKGKVILDGAYAHFYCDNWNAESSAFLEAILRYFASG